MGQTNAIGLGGGCHWCTEAVFQSVQGVIRVEQGYIGSLGEAAPLSEAVIVHFDPELISAAMLIEIHLHTHKSTSDHSFRDKYRSAVYYFEESEKHDYKGILKLLQRDFENSIVTKVLPKVWFKPSRESIQDYYRKNREAPFCQRYIIPKLEKLRTRFPENSLDQCTV